MTFRIFPQPKQVSEAEDRAPVFGKRRPHEPTAPGPKPLRMVEAVALGLGAATLAYLVFETL